jgi:predicted ATP-grasp superfamily ATP-dependent carboligase
VVLSDTDVSTPVLLLCGNTAVGALGALRSLGRLGVPVYALDSERHGRVWASRYCKKCFDWDPLHNSVEESLERLHWVGRQLGSRTVLVPTFDEAAIFAAQYAPAMRDQFIYPAQDPELVRRLVSKKEMYFLARDHGFPVPHTTWPISRAEVVEFAKDAKFPVALKAIRGTRLKLRARVTAFIVQSSAELLELYDRYEDSARPNLMLQEYIPGDDSCGWGFNGYFNDRSECVFGGTTHRIHQYPVHVGITSLAVIEHDPRVDAAARSFMRAIGYRGLVNIGFRYDARAGEYKVVDVNPRLGASFRSFVTQDGGDILRACYCDLTGQAITAGSSRPSGRKWLLELDLRSCMRYRREGASLQGLIGSYQGVRELAYFSGDDPFPLFAACLGMISRPATRWAKSRDHSAPVKSQTSAFGV